MTNDDSGIKQAMGIFGAKTLGSFTSAHIEVIQRDLLKNTVSQVTPLKPDGIPTSWVIDEIASGFLERDWEIVCDYARGFPNKTKVLPGAMLRSIKPSVVTTDGTVYFMLSNKMFVEGLADVLSWHTKDMLTLLGLVARRPIQKIAILLKGEFIYAWTEPKA